MMVMAMGGLVKALYFQSVIMGMLCNAKNAKKAVSEFFW